MDYIPQQPSAETPPEPARPPERPLPPEMTGEVSQASGESPVAESEQEDAFGADLTRDEYIRGNLYVMRTVGILRQQKTMRILMVVMMAFVLCLFLVDVLKYRTIEMDIVLLAGFLLVCVAGLQFVLPAWLRHKAGKAYDETVRTGYDYYGTVRVYPDRIEKRNSAMVNAVRFAQNAVYIEAPEMLIMLSPQSRAIVLPARCLTAADADRVRKVARTALLGGQQRFFGRLIPTAAQRMQAPAACEPREREDTAPVIELRVDYTPEEFRKLSNDITMRNYVHLLPLYGGSSLLLGVMFTLLYNPLTGLIGFVGMALLSFLLATQMNRVRVRSALLRMSDADRMLRFRFYDNKVMVSSPAATAAGQEMTLLWTAISRAVERPDSVELYSGGGFLRIPKRCIEDMDALRAFVDAHMPPRDKQ